MLHNVLNKDLLDNKDCLVICPSRGRAEKIKEMVNSFLEKTSQQTGLLIAIDEDDPQIEQYKEFLGSKVAYHVGKQMTTTAIFNNMLKLFPDYKYYMLSNDDFVYLSAVWDIKLMSDIEEMGGWGVAYGDDRVQGERMCTSPMISGNIIRLLGWLQMQSLKCLFNDNVWMSIGTGIGRIHYDNNVVIQHKHPIDGKTLADETFERTNSEQNYKMDLDAYKRWVKTEARGVISKILKAMFSENKFTKTLSVCMIIKQEEDLRNIKQCLDSVNGWVEEACIYINYSLFPNYFKIEAIKRLILGYEKSMKVRVSSGKFESFSQARNVTLKQATSTHIIWLDTDDLVPAPWTLKDIIFRHPDHDVFILHVISHNAKKADEHIMQTRLLKRYDYLEFRNNVHEDIGYSYKKHNPNAKVLRTDVLIEHMGNMDWKRVIKKNWRNYQLTLKEINSPDAHSLTYFAIVNELMLMGTKESAKEAVEWIDKYMDKFPDTGKDPLVPKMWILRGACALTCDQVDAAKTNFSKAWTGWKHPEAAVMLGECDMRLGNFDKAINILEEIKAKTEFEVCNVPIDMQTIELEMLSKLGFAYYKKAQSIYALKKSAAKMYNEEAKKLADECIDNAKKNFEEFLTMSTGNLEIADKLAEIYRQSGNISGSNSIIVSMVNIFKSYAKGWKLLGMFELTNKRYETSKVFFEKSLKIDPKDSEVRHNLNQLRKIK